MLARNAVSGSRHSRTAAVAMAASVALCLIAACTAQDPPAVELEPEPPPVWQMDADPSAAPVLSESVATTVEGGASFDRKLGARLDDPSLGSNVGAAVLDVVDGSLVYGEQQASGLVPASTLKLVTTATALSAMGPDHRFTTRVVAGTKPGQVVIAGGGDPMLSARKPNSKSTPRRSPLSTLVARTAAALEDRGVDRVQVLVDDGLFSGPATDPDWRFPFTRTGIVAPVTALSLDGGRINPERDARSGDPSMSAGREFADQLTSAGLNVAGEVVRGTAPSAPPSGTSTATPTPATTPAIPSTGTTAATPTAEAAPPWTPGEVLAELDSAPLAQIVEFTLTTSDNDAAEMLARHVALADGLPGSSQDAEKAVRARLEQLGIDLKSVVIADGSGLSASNRLTPLALSEVLLVSYADSNLSAVRTGLAVAGLSGTLAERFPPSGSTKAGVGFVRAKTGTLSGVNALAGVVTAADGGTYIFVFLADETGSTPAARAALDRSAATLAACGCSRTVDQ